MKRSAMDDKIIRLAVRSLQALLLLSSIQVVISAMHNYISIRGWVVTVLYTAVVTFICYYVEPTEE